MNIIKELDDIDKYLLKVRSKIAKWTKRERDLLEKKNELQREIPNLNSNTDIRTSCVPYSTLTDNIDCSGQWHDVVKRKLWDVFKVKKCRQRQLQAINLALSGEDGLVVMPTGAGKSLCYQLPALVNPGFTLVISPLVSLMEDQVKSLTEKNISALLMSSSNAQQRYTALTHLEQNTNLKLLYVTPEQLFKNTELMKNLQNSYKNGKLQRIAIDEVHCCAQWGESFREDYKRLDTLKSIFPNVPILGYTATATSRTLIDVQKILNISGCQIIKSPINRPNLFYQILEKPSSQKECLDILESLLKYRYNGQSGIIYVYSKNNSEELARELIKRNLKVACYHGNLDASEKSKVQTNWHRNDIQAIIATEAFGMGIDKQDVRFVIHHTISKTMENYYQESGRAGRDGQRAECVILYRMQDIFSISALVYSNGKSKDPLYAMIKYCLNGRKCRRQLLAEYLDEKWSDTDCYKMCDVCYNDPFDMELDLEQVCRTIAGIITKASEEYKMLTAKNILDTCVQQDAFNSEIISRNRAEDAIAFLLTEEYLEEIYHPTPFQTFVYIKEGKNMHLAHSPNFSLRMPIRKYFIDSFNITQKAPNVFKEPKSNKSRTISVD